MLFAGSPTASKKLIGSSIGELKISELSKEKQMSIETRLDRIERLLETIDGRVSNNTALGEKNTAACERNSAHIEQNRKAIERNGESIAFLIKKMDEGHKQIIRHFEVAREDFRSEMRAFGEGIGINRERLDNHDRRLTKLESTG
jgi:chromosome segregation ATPase